MLNQATLDKLAALKLTGMAAAYEKAIGRARSARSQLRGTLRHVGRQSLDVA